MRRPPTALAIGWLAMALMATGCASTTGGQPIAVVTSPTSGGASVPWDGTSTTTSSLPASSSSPASPSPAVSTSSGVSTTSGESTTSRGRADLSGGVTGSITWNTGSMPPPYNYSWTAEFTATSGTFTLHTNYAADDKSWSQEFTVTPESMAALTAALAAAGVGAEGPPSDEHSVGGSTGSYRLTAADGTELHASLGDSSATSTELGRISDAVETFVGPTAWNTAMNSYQEWASEYH